MVLTLEEVVLFFGRHSHREGLPCRIARDIEFSMRGPVNWVRRTAQVEVTKILCLKAVELLQIPSWKRK